MSGVNVLRDVLKPTLLALSLAVALPLMAADKVRIEKQADIPVFSYAISEPLDTVVRDRAIFTKVVARIREDMESVLAKYDIADKASHLFAPIEY